MQKSRNKTNPGLFPRLFMAYLSACGSHQNYPLIDYLQGTDQRKKTNGLDIKSPL